VILEILAIDSTTNVAVEASKAARVDRPIARLAKVTSRHHGFMATPSTCIAGINLIFAQPRQVLEEVWMFLQ